MTHPNKENNKSRSSIEKQAIAAIESDSTIIEVITAIDFSGYRSLGDTYDEWHASYRFEPMLRALYLKDLMGYSNTDLHRRLSDNPEEAEALGFESLASRTTFGRTWRNRLSDDLRTSIQHTTHRILEYAREEGNPLGLHSLEPDEKSDVSERTENRLIEEKAKEVTEEMQELVFPAFGFNRASNARYETEAFCELQSRLGLSSCAAETGTTLFADDTKREKGTPDADTHLRNIKRLDQEGIRAMIDEGICRMLRHAKRNLEFDRPVDVAIDMTYVAYYGERDEVEMIMGAPDTKAYDWCYKFATLTVVGENVKFTLAMQPVQKGDTVGEVVRELYWQARERVNIRMVYADSEFCSADTIHALEEAGVKYVIPSPKNKRVKREIGRMEQDVKVLNEYTIYGQVKGETSNHPAPTNLILLPSSADDDKTIAFITNKDVDDEIRLDWRRAKGIVDRYSRRWGIENSYKTIKDFLAWTTSKDFTVRLFYFGFAVLLYNMWLLVDLLVQVSLDVEHRYKPRVTAKRFLNLARKRLGAG